MALWGSRFACSYGVVQQAIVEVIDSLGCLREQIICDIPSPRFPTNIDAIDSVPVRRLKGLRIFESTTGTGSPIEESDFEKQMYNCYSSCSRVIYTSKYQLRIDSVHISIQVLNHNARSKSTPRIGKPPVRGHIVHSGRIRRPLPPRDRSENVASETSGHMRKRRKRLQNNV